MLLGFVCVCVCKSVLVPVSVCIHLCVHMWRPEVYMRCPASLHHNFFATGYLIEMCITVWAWKASQKAVRGFTFSNSSSPMVTSIHYHAQLRHRSRYLLVKHVIY